MASTFFGHSQNRGNQDPQQDRIRMLIERSFNSPEEEARILNIVRQLDKKYKDQSESASRVLSRASTDQPEEAYVYGADASNSTGDINLFGGSMPINVTQAMPNRPSSSSATAYQHCPTPAPSTQPLLQANKRPSPGSSLDLMLGSAPTIAPPTRPPPPTSSSRQPSSSSSSRPPAAPRTSEPKSSSSRSTAGASSGPIARWAASQPALKDSITQDDFTGIESVCLNAGASADALESLLCAAFNPSSPEAVVVLAAVYSDGNTSLQDVTNRYCTPSAQCANWMCSCDRHIRAVESTEKFIGVTVLLTSSSGGEPDPLVHFLPLVSCIEPAPEDITSLGATQPLPPAAALPLHCQTTLAQRWEALLTILAARSVAKVVFNAQLFLFPIMNHLQQLSTHTVITEACTNVWDPKIATYLCDTDVPEENLELYNLLVQFRLPIQSNPAAVHSNAGKLTRIFHRLRSEMAALTALKRMQEAEFRVREGLLGVYHSLEMPVVVLLSSMESLGLRCDVDLLHSLHGQLTKVIGELEDTARDMVRGTSGGGGAGGAEAFNLASPEQVAGVLFGELMLPHSAVSAGAKHPSTSEESLQKIRHLHPLVDVILQFRAANKLLTTYCGPALTQFVHSGASGVGGVRRIHANWNQTTVRTGRLSCSRPNLQNIPNEQTIGEASINVRDAMEAPPGHILVSADYSQIEMRVLAHLCQDPALLALFSRDRDIYRQLAGRILSKRPESVSAEERNKAKVVCLGVLYGMGAQATAAKLGIEVAAANQITGAFFGAFRQMKSWIHNVKSQAKQQGFIRTLLGRRRYLPDIQSTDRSKSSLGERQAVNSVIQGSASDIIKHAMINVDRALGRRWAASTSAEQRRPSLVMQIHDELIYCLPVTFFDDLSGEGGEQLSTASAAELEQFVRLLHLTMNEEVVGALRLRTPLLVNVKRGRRWGSMQDYTPPHNGSTAASTTSAPGVAVTHTSVTTTVNDEEEVGLPVGEDESNDDGDGDALLGSYYESNYVHDEEEAEAADEEVSEEVLQEMEAYAAAEAEAAAAAEAEARRAPTASAVGPPPPPPQSVLGLMEDDTDW